MNVRVERERAFDDLERARLQKPVGRDDDAADAVLFDEEADDVRRVVAQGRLAAREPEVCDCRHRSGDALDLLEGQIAGTVQLLVIETRLALRVTT
jgi:hypothetical protein